MKQIIQNYKSGELKVLEVPLPLIRKGGVLVRNYFSVISAGTERATFKVSEKGYLGKALEKPEQVKQIIQTAKSLGLKKTFDLVMNKLNIPIALGYSSSGTVIEVGNDAYEFQIRDGVACAGQGYASHAEVIFVPKNLCVKIPDGVQFDEAAFTTLGAIALQGIRNADVCLGETVAVIGLGLIGLLTVQLLKAAGCVVIAFDIDSTAVENGSKCGADYSFHADSDDVYSSVQSLTQNHGVDAVIIAAATKSNDPVEFAGKTCKKKGRVVVVGDVGMNIPRSLYYAKELDFIISCSYGPGRYDPNYEEYGIDYPIGYVRWTEKRNMEAFLQLIKEKKIDLSKMITHRFKIEQATDAYNLITGKAGQKFMGVLLEYDYSRNIEPSIKIKEVQQKKISPINIGLVGAGNFMQSTLLPLLRKNKNITLRAVVAAEGHLSQNVAKKFGIDKCYSTSSSIFSDEEINTVIIATRHNLHAAYVIEGLRNNKQVYVEKPLAFSEDELRDVIKVRNKANQDVFVGFNRRFAPHIEKCREFLAKRNAPLFINYRINAGFIPSDNWIQSRVEGGGRIIGEVCHFIDLCQFLCHSGYKSIFAQNIGRDELRENVSIIIKFDDLSVANIHYLANGDKSFSKERIEIFCQNSIAVIDDFKKLELIRNGRRKIHKAAQDKGHQRQIELWFKSIEKNQPIPIPFIESVNSTIATFMVHESLNKEQVIYFNEYSQKFFE
jgi:predicted dehydrogenase